MKSTCSVSTFKARQIRVPRLSVIDVTVNPPINNADATGRYCTFPNVTISTEAQISRIYIGLKLAIYFYLQLTNVA